MHGTTGEEPQARFERDEAQALRPLADRPPFRACRMHRRRVRNDCTVEVDGNAYSVPWRLIGETVEVVIATGQVRVRHGASEVAVHALHDGRRQRIVDPVDLAGVAGFGDWIMRVTVDPPEDAPPVPELLRPLAEYEALAEGGF